MSHQALGQLTCPVAIIHKLLSFLNDKEQEVIVKRFGLLGNEQATLASIGNKFSVTRERVRQIQNYSIKKLQRNVAKTNLTELREWIKEILKQQGEIVTESKLENYLKMEFPDQPYAELKLALVLFPEIIQESNKIYFRPHFRSEQVSMKQIKKMCKLARIILKENQKVLSANQLVSKMQERLKEEDINLRKKLLLACLKLDRRITIKSNGISLSKWRNVNPKTLYDKIVYLLKKEDKPLHFTEITNLIIESKFDKKSVNQHAVHNELIKRKDFVLIGRGRYALKEWGYKSGTVADVITEILVENGPMKYDNLIKKVLEERQVKAVTVQININNRQKFVRDNQDMISLTS